MKKGIFVFLIIFHITLFISAKKIAEFDEIYKPRQLVVMGNDLYIVDGEAIKLLSIKKSKLIKHIGRKGEGPGEFKFWPQITVFQDSIFVLDRSPLNKKIVFFSRKGEFISERKLPRFTTVKRVKQNYLSRELTVSPDRKKNTTIVRVVDSDFHLLKELYSDVEKASYSNMGAIKTDYESFPKMKFSVTDGNFIYIVDTNKGFFLEIYDHFGKKLSTIVKKIEKIRFTEEHKKKLIDKMKKSKYWNSMKKMYNFIYPEYFPAIGDVYGENNKIYVFTYKNLNNTTEIISIDHKGNILKKSYVPRGHPSNIHNNKFYYLQDNEDEEVWELHVEDL